MTFRNSLHTSFAAFCLSVSAILFACGSDKSETRPAAESMGGTSANTTTSSEPESTRQGTGGESTSSTSTSTGGKSGSTTNASGGQSVASSSTTTSTPESGCSEGDEEEGYVDVPFSDPNIRYVGRVNRTSSAAQFAFPAVQIQTTFEGDAIDMRLRDYGFGLPNATNYYWIIIDGEAKKLEVCQARQVYPLARNLDAGTHTLTIVKRTESGPGGQSNAGKGEFLGFRVRPGTALKAVSEPTRRMEFVGDSITCGYGNELSIDDPSNSPFTAVNEDGWSAYGAVAARKLNADYVAVAASGRGVIRNYGGFKGDVVPVLYERTLPDQRSAPAWDHASYSPDVIVVNLGTNDYSPGIELDQYEAHRTAFKQAYVDFLTRIREVHADATIVVAVGPMMNDDFPAGYNAWTSIRADVKEIVETRRTAPDEKTHYFEFEPHSAPYGEDYHPTLATHQAMADALSTFICDLMGW